jgi:hypothetical protein
MSKLSAPAQGSQSRPGSRPDFVTGFGLDMQEQQAEGGEDQDKGERLEADGDADNGDEEGSEKQEEVLSWAAKVREAEERDDDAFVAAHTVQNGEIVSSGLDGSKDEEDVEVDMDLDVDAAARVVRALEEEGRSQGSRTPTDVEEFEYTDSSFGGMQNGAGIHSEATFGGPGFMGMGGQLGSGISPSMSPLTPRLAGFAQGAGMGLEQIEEEGSMDGVSTAAHSRHHSRHASRLSAALSLRSVGGPVGGSPIASTLAKAQERAEERRRRREEEGMQGMHEYEGMEDVEEGPGVEDGKLHGHGDEEVGDWTGSEDLRDLSDDEVNWVLEMKEVQWLNSLLLFFRASASGQTRLTKRGLVQSARSAALRVGHSTRQDAYRTSRGRPRMHRALGTLWVRMTSCPTHRTRNTLVLGGSARRRRS